MPQNCLLAARLISGLVEAAVRVHAFQPLRSSLPAARSFTAALVLLLCVLESVFAADVVTGLAATAVILVVWALGTLLFDFLGSLSAAFRQSALPIWNVSLFALVSGSALKLALVSLGAPVPMVLLGLWTSLAWRNATVLERRRLAGVAR